MTLLCLGGVVSDPENEEHVKIVCHALLNRVLIHTCLKYGDAIKLIKKCMVVTNMSPRLILKLYINSSERWLKSSINDQLTEVWKILGPVKIEIIQLCCNPPYSSLSVGMPFREKLQYLRYSELIDKIYIEVYWQYSRNATMFLDDNFFDGFIFYHNIYLRETSNAFYAKIGGSTKDIITMRSLAGNTTPYISNFSLKQRERLIDIMHIAGYKEFIDFKIAFIKSTPHLVGAVIGVSKFNHYIELLHKFSNIYPMAEDIRGRILRLQDEVWAHRGVGNGEGLQRLIGRKNISIIKQNIINWKNCFTNRKKTGYDW